MMRKLAVALLLPLALLAMVACSDDDNGGDDTEDQPTAEETAGDSSDEPTDESTEEDSASIDDSDDGASGAAALFGSFNPLEVLSASGDAPSAGPGDPDLQKALLTESDVPSDYMAMGDMNYSLPTEYGEANMAMSMFAGGDLMAGDLEAMILSAALQMPPEALADIESFSELSEISESELEDAFDVASASSGGFAISDVRLLDASGLGEGGAGIHMVMDFGALLGAFGPTDGADNPFANGVAVDMYMFGRGDTMLMLMVMEPADGGAGLDGKALAETMDGKIS
jgi:hypothetical protein